MAITYSDTQPHDTAQYVQFGLLLVQDAVAQIDLFLHRRSKQVQPGNRQAFLRHVTRQAINAYLWLEDNPEDAGQWKIELREIAEAIDFNPDEFREQIFRQWLQPKFRRQPDPQFLHLQRLVQQYRSYRRQAEAERQRQRELKRQLQTAQLQFPFSGRR